MEENKNMQLFMGLCTSLVSQAWMQLGKIKNPMTDEINVDLNAASLTIDMLAMLKEKTKGNISDDEAKILDQSISELKMNFVMSKDNEETSEEKPVENSEKTDEKEK
jgi:deoxyhypusine synthase